MPNCPGAELSVFSLGTKFSVAKLSGAKLSYNLCDMGPPKLSFSSLSTFYFKHDFSTHRRGILNKIKKNSVYSSLREQPRSHLWS